jgi:hypothetical protein
LRIVDLLPDAVVAALRKSFGSRFDALGQNESLTIGATASEKVVSHARVREITALHPFDLTRMLQDLVRDGYLEVHNSGRGAVYCLPGAALPKPEVVSGDGSKQSLSSSEHLALDATADEHRFADVPVLASLLTSRAEQHQRKKLQREFEEWIRSGKS